MAITPQQARAELARRELERRQTKESSIPSAPKFQPEEPTGWGAVGQDIAGLPEKGLNYIGNVASNLEPAIKQFGSNPLRAAGTVLAGAGEGAIGALNAPHEMLKYLGKKEVIPHWLQTYNELPFTHIPETGIEKRVLGAEQPGDVALKFAGGLVNPAGAAKGMGYNLTNKLKKMHLHKMEKELEKSGMSAEEAKAVLDEATAQADLNHGVTTPRALERKINTSKGALAEKAIQLNENPLHPHPGELKPFEALTEPKEPEPLADLPPHEALTEPVAPEAEHPELPPEHVYEEKAPEASHYLKTAAQKSAEAEANLSAHLGEGLAHRKRVGTKINPILEKRQADVGKEYDKFEEGLKGHDLELSSPRDAKQISQDINELVKKGDYESPEIQKLGEELQSVQSGKRETIPADKFVAAYRSLRTMAQKTRTSAYGKSPTEFNHLIERADSMDADVGRMKEVIDKNLGTDNLEQLNKINHRYATEVAPLFKNPFFQHLQAKGKAPIGMMEQLTNEPYVKSTAKNKVTGSHILNEIIRNDPEMLKHLIGEKYAHQPGKLHDFDELTNEFLQHMPETQELIKQHAEALAAHRKATHEHKEATAHDVEQKAMADARIKEREAIVTEHDKKIKAHKVAVKAHEKKVKKQNDTTKAHEKKKSDMQTAYENAQKAHEKKLAKQESIKKTHRIQTNKHEKSKRERAKLERAHAKQTAEIEAMEKTLPELKAKAYAQKQTLKQKHESMLAYDAAKKDLYKRRAALAKIAKWGLKILSKGA